MRTGDRIRARAVMPPRVLRQLPRDLRRQLKRAGHKRVRSLAPTFSGSPRPVGGFWL
ncbi:MAG TPA: hypothetical protein VGD86_02355 [Devosia sp.]